MEQSNYFIKHYDFNGCIYEINGSEDFHHKLVTDVNYWSSYFKTVVDSQTVSVENNDVSLCENEEASFVFDQLNKFESTEHDMTEKDLTVQDIGEQEAYVETSEDVSDEVIQKVNKEANEEDIGAWDNPVVKLLLDEYSIRKQSFRSPKIKKIKLWREISVAFKKHGLNRSAETIQRKFGNMKTTYSSIKKNNSKKTTGTGRKPWPWLKAMDEIFNDDVSINFKQDAVASMDVDGNNGALNLSKPSSGSRDAECTSSVVHEAKASSSSDVNFAGDSEMTSPKFCKSAKGKNTYYQRQKQFDLDSKKLEVMRELKDTLEECKKMPKENLLIRTEKMHEITQAYKERNEILKNLSESQNLNSL